jgi:hypothetical protein
MTRPVLHVSGAGLPITCLALILAFLSGCTSERSVEPEPGKHRIYFGGGYVFRQDLTVVEVDNDTSRQIIDTVPDFGWVVAAIVSPDGRWLYAARQNNGGPLELVKLNTVTLAVEGAIQEDGSPWQSSDYPHDFPSLVLVDDGRTLVWALEGDLWVIDAESFVVREIRERGMYQVRGLEGTSLISGVTLGQPVVYDVGRDMVVASGPLADEEPDFRVRSAVLHPDGEHLYCIGYDVDRVFTAHPDLSLSVVSIQEWSKVAEREIATDYVDVAFGPGGRPVFVTECCTWHVFTNDPRIEGGWIDLLSPTTLTHLNAVSTGPSGTHWPLYWLNLSPDGRLMYVFDMKGEWPVLAIDSRTGETVFWMDRPRRGMLAVIAVGPAPE